MTLKNRGEKVKQVMERATCVFTKAEVDAALDRMAKEMKQCLCDKNPVFLCVLLGGVVPLGNLLPRLDFELEINYIHMSSYAGTTQRGELFCKAKPSISLEDRTVVIVDDILDTGVTLRATTEFCLQEKAKEVLTAVLIDKRKPRKVNGLERADFTGLVMDDRFVFGYGLDYDEFLRNAPGIYVVADEDM